MLDYPIPSPISMIFFLISKFYMWISFFTRITYVLGLSGRTKHTTLARVVKFPIPSLKLLVVVMWQDEIDNLITLADKVDSIPSKNPQNTSFLQKVAII